MFSRIAIVAAFAALVVASPMPNVGGGSTPPPSNNCNVGSVQCCQSVQSNSNPLTSTLLGLLGVAIPIGANVPIGVTCSPISVVGVGNGPSCSAQPVCCENNSFNGVVAIGCTPINIGL